MVDRFVRGLDPYEAAIAFQALDPAVQAEANAFAAEDWEAVAEAHHRLAELNGYDAESRAATLMHGLGFARMLTPLLPPEVRERILGEVGSLKKGVVLSRETAP